MLRFANDFNNLVVVSLIDGRQIASVEGLVINPHNLSVAAFACRSNRQREIRYLVGKEIRTISAREIIVNSEEVLTDLSELLRLQQYVEINYQIIGKSVRTDRKRRVGAVTDYAIDDTTLIVEKIYVRPPLTKILRSSDRVIGRQQIVEVGDKFIIVKDVTVTERRPVVEDIAADA